MHNSPLVIIRGKEYLIDSKLQCLHLKACPEECIPFFQLDEEEEFLVQTVLQRKEM